MFYLSGWWRKDEPHAKSRWLVEFIGFGFIHRLGVG
ncbi:Uncharacterised protein [Vibrio cholerae]|nr:Uncharacterised protein [Vibrio cholerae]